MAESEQRQSRVCAAPRYGVLLLLLIGTVLVLGACAAGPNPAVGVPGSDGDAAGFLFGVWHGAITPVTFVISLFTDTVSVYEVHNTGNWYDFGFFFGLMVFMGGSHGASRKGR